MACYESVFNSVESVVDQKVGNEISTVRLTYYSQNAINQRHRECLDNCNTGDGFCMFYCNSKVTDDTMTAVDIQLGEKNPGRQYEN